MEGKYTSRLRFEYGRVRRAILRLLLRTLLEWKRLDDPQDGYTIIIGCSGRLLPVARANLAMLRLQDLTGLRAILLVIDETQEKLGQPSLDALRSDFSDLPLKVIFYSKRQKRIARLVNWAWVYSWLSWSIGISRTETRYAILHDLDSMLIAPRILRERYEAIVRRSDQYVGERFYEGNGVLPEYQLAATYEFVFDVPFVRDHFRPIDLFNHVATRSGRSIDYDTFLWAQHQCGRASVLRIPEEDMVHPSQMICQFAELAYRGRQPSRAPNIVLLPYLFFLGGDRDAMQRVVGYARPKLGRMPFFGTELELARVDESHAAWLEKQAARLEVAIHGHVRPEVQEYFAAVRDLAGLPASALSGAGICPQEVGS
jgi:hypothetical protein